MDDDLEDKVFYQTYVSHVKLVTRFAVGAQPAASAAMAAVLRLCRVYLLRPDVFFLSIVLIVFLYYLQAVELWSRGMLDRIASSFGTSGTRRLTRSQLLAQMSLERHSWQLQNAQSACYAVQGRRATMEDRYVIDENVSNTDVALFAIFDGHGGDYAADFAKSQLIPSIRAKIADTMSALRGITSGHDSDDDDTTARQQYNRNRLNNNRNSTTNDAGGDNKNNNSKSGDASASSTPSKTAAAAAAASAVTSQRRASLKKSFSTADDCGMNPSNCNREQDAFLDKLNSIIGGGKGTGSAALLGIDASTTAKASSTKAQTYDGRTYIENGGTVNFGKMMVDEVLAADDVLIEHLQKKALLAGTTALMAIIHRSRLIVANVGDSRGVMCDWRGNAIPLSFDHKPQQVRERKRIQDAGGFISFKGVWRVAGILATSRALGDYPLKQNKKLVIATPDILSFDLQDHKPKFLILASDGLWDTFSNEEAVAFIRKHLHEPLFGAKSLTHQAYQRGSVDNISVLVIAFKNDKFHIGYE